MIIGAVVLQLLEIEYQGHLLLLLLQSTDCKKRFCSPLLLMYAVKRAFFLVSTGCMAAVGF